MILCEKDLKTTAALALPLLDLVLFPPDPCLPRWSDLENYTRLRLIPWGRDPAGRLIIAAVSPDDPAVVRFAEQLEPGALRIACRPFDITRCLQQLWPEALLRRASDDLAAHHPQQSARHVGRGWLLPGLVAGLILLSGLALVAPDLLRWLFYLMAGLLLGGHFGLRLLMCRRGDKARPPPVPPLATHDLPLYSLLIPLFHETAVIDGLAEALAALDYPADRLDIKLILESDDLATIAAARQAAFPPQVELILVPAGLPRTKPKACNYALQFARGELVVIYDAEDRPEPDQLRKAAAAYAAGPADLGCVQARLNFYNIDDNWLTRLFTLDYALWFDNILPGLAAAALPIPLGGTSNHFRTDLLRAIGAWDPYNVTEDADLGLRLAAEGWQVQLIDSTTYEEANNALGNWLRQRSRWLKGYLQTWAVHMRRPRRLVARIGWRGVLAVHLMLPGTVLSALIMPFLLGDFLWRCLTMPMAGPGEWLSLAIALSGNGFFIHLLRLAPRRRGWLDLKPWAWSAPVYWGLISLAAYRALWRLVWHPSHWDKTRHGLARGPVVIRSDTTGRQS